MDKPEINHFNDFVAFLKAQTVLSDSFRDSLILRLNAAMADAYDRGKQDGYERGIQNHANLINRTILGR